MDSRGLNRLTIYRSSAGSGKTFTLVLNYLRIALLRPEAFDEILAITFTNKATEEMKMRLVNTVARLAGNQPTQMDDLLVQLTALTQQEIAQRSRVLLKLMLHRYSDLSVMTIDSFFYRLLQPIARELGIALSSGIEMDTDKVIREVKHRLLLDIGKDPETTMWMQEFIADKLEEKDSWKTADEIEKLIEELIEDDENKNAEASEPVTLDFVRTLRKIKYGFESTLQQYGAAFRRQLVHHNLSVDDLKKKSKGIAGWFLKAERGELELKEPNESTEKALRSAEEWITKTHKQRDRIIQAVNSAFIPLLDESLNYFKQHYKTIVSINAVLELIYVAGIAGKLKAKLNEYRDENEVLLLSDINRLISRSLTINDTAFIFEKTGVRYRHILIDEFQDTSLIQWNNLLPLIENSLSSGGSVMTVGDAKQSIYRWRGGRMELILSDINQKLNHFSNITDEQELLTNYRSACEIIDFNNRFFPVLSRIKNDWFDTMLHVAEQVYSDISIRQKTHDSTPVGGFAEVRLIRKSQDEKKLKDDIRLMLASLMFERIQQALQDGFTMNDLAILVRDNKEAEYIVNFLYRKGIHRILSPESMLAGQSDKVQLLLHAMKFLQNPGDDLSRAGLLYFFSKIQSHADENNPFLKSKQDDEFEKALPAEFSSRRNLLQALPLVDLCEHLIRLFRIEPDSFTIRFQDAVLEFISTVNGGLYEFLEWWNEKEDKQAVTVPQSADAIRVLTIHKSKGLEFPVVLVPFAMWSTRPRSDLRLWVRSDLEPFANRGWFQVRYHRQLNESEFRNAYQTETELSLLDNINLLYVAFTRAVSRLHVFGVEHNNPFENVSAFITAVLTDPSFNANCMSDDQWLYFSTGSLSKKNVTVTQAETHILGSDRMLSSPWINRIALAINKDRISVKDEPGAAQGLKFHWLMASILTESDAERLFNTLPVEQEMKKQIISLLDKCRPYGWFSEKFTVRTECPLLFPDGSVLRPDRLMFSGHEVVLLDYKTGEIQSGHKEQMENYAKALTAAGYHLKSSYIYYTRSNELIQSE